LILDNLRELSATGVEIWIRFPLIPGFNDSVGNLDATAGFVGSLAGRHPVFVLPYHATGADKHRRLGQSPPDVELRAPTEREIEAAVERLRSHGLEVHTGGAA
jgi:pyruvate formate lyase activating enzyme